LIPAATSARGGTATSTERPRPRRARRARTREPDEAAVELLPAVDLPPELALPLLRTGAVEPLGRIVAASNATLLCTVSDEVPGRGRVTAAAIHKPVDGERPLWDFPDGTLAHREVAAHLLSEASGWQVVPPTVFRDDGPFGPGMLQLWIGVHEDVDVVELLQAADPRLRRIALFDAIANNADRKAGHLLVRPDGLVQGIDHGVTFHVEPKLRTVLWGWRGTLIAPRELTVLAMLRELLRDGRPLAAGLVAHLAPEEVEATRDRLERLLATGRFPQPSPDWPAVPWPWY